MLLPNRKHEEEGMRLIKEIHEDQLQRNHSSHPPTSQDKTRIH